MLKEVRKCVCLKTSIPKSNWGTGKPNKGLGEELHPHNGTSCFTKHYIDNPIPTDSLLQYVVKREKYIPYKREAAVAQDLGAHRLCGGRHMGPRMQRALGQCSCSKP